MFRRDERQAMQYSMAIQQEWNGNSSGGSQIWCWMRRWWGKKRHGKCGRKQITPRSDEQEGPSLLLAEIPHQNLGRETWFTSLIALCQQICVESTYKNSHQFSTLSKPHSSSQSSSDTRFCVVEILCCQSDALCYDFKILFSVCLGFSKIKKCI